MELELSDEQYRKIGQEISMRLRGWNSDQEWGRAAVDAVLAEVLPIVRGAIYDGSQQGVGDGARRWVYMDQVNQVLARFTAPKDAAVEAVLPLLDKVLRHEEAPSNIVGEVVAAVRAADREAGRKCS